MTQPQIAIPVGLFKSGKSGAGGDLNPLVKIRRDIFQLTNMVYGLQMTGAYKGLDPKSIIIDIEYDGYKMEDPQSARPMSFVTDDPKQTDRGTWFGTFKAPNAGEQYSALGKHKVKVSVAPRQAPLTQMHMTIVVPKDGATKTVTTTITTKKPVYGISPCSGKSIITGYEDVVETSSMEVPAETVITYEGYSVKQVLGPRDFSPEAGGAVQEFEFEIFPSNIPPYDLPQE
jgi:hypothetical protein